MDSLKHMNAALRYIEDNLAGEIDYQEVARRALSSEYHFKRMFSILAGIPLSEYIRRRRLTLAALELQDRRMRVIDLAVKYGYTSADAFTRAFQSLHGITPSEARSQAASLKAYPPMTFQLTIKGASEMQYRFEEKEPFRIVGIMKRVPIVFQGENPEIAAMVNDLDAEKIALLKSLSNTEPRGMLSASANFDEGRMEERGKLDHYIGVATTSNAPAHLAQLDVPASTWAVFTPEGPYPQGAQEAWGRIFAEWFPGSGYELSEGPEILWTSGPNPAAADFRSEIWIPVRKSR